MTPIGPTCSTKKQLHRVAITPSRQYRIAVMGGRVVTAEVSAIVLRYRLMRRRLGAKVLMAMATMTFQVRNDVAVRNWVTGNLIPPCDIVRVTVCTLGITNFTTPATRQQSTVRIHCNTSSPSKSLEAYHRRLDTGLRLSCISRPRPLSKS
jgi:hypothetical protein